MLLQEFMPDGGDLSRGPGSGVALEGIALGVIKGINSHWGIFKAALFVG